MDDEIQYFMNYLRDEKKVSRNTEMSYHSDLAKMAIAAV